MFRIQQKLHDIGSSKSYSKDEIINIIRSERAQMLELPNTDLKITMIKTLKDLTELGSRHNEMENSSDIEAIRKDHREMLKLKTQHQKLKIFLDGFNNKQERAVNFKKGQL